MGDRITALQQLVSPFGKVIKTTSYSFHFLFSDHSDNIYWSSKFINLNFCQTDTASVLSDAIEYIKFLHDQISVSTTYFTYACYIYKDSFQAIYPSLHN